MKILFVTQFFYPENFRINDLALRLKDRGHQVTVLTGLPNYPGGKLFEGYSVKGPYREDYQGVEILRCPVIPRGQGSARLAINYLSFILMGCFAAADLVRRPGGGRAREFDVIYAFGTSPITQALPALLIRQMRGTPVILNVQDLWPDNVTAITGLHSRAALWGLDRMVDFIYNRCDVILGTSHSFVKAIRSRKGLKQKKKVGYYPQYSVVKPDGTEPLRRDLLPEGVFHIVFAGNIGEGQGLDTMLEAVRIYEKHLKADGPEIVFDLFGDGRARERLETLVKEQNLTDSVVFHGRVEEKEIPGILKTADAALLILNPSPIFEKTIPAKLQTYLACGSPVLACVEGEAKWLIEKHQLGICSRIQTPESLAEAIKTLVNTSAEERAAMSKRSITISETEFDPEILTDKMEEYMEILSRR